MRRPVTCHGVMTTRPDSYLKIRVMSEFLEEPLDPEDRLHPLKRRVYLIALGLSLIAAIAGAVLLVSFDQTAKEQTWWALPALAVWLAICWLLVYLRSTWIRGVDLLVFGGVALFFLYNTYQNFRPFNLQPQGLWLTDLWQGAVYLLAFLIFGGRRAIWAAGLFLLAQVLVGVAALAPSMNLGRRALDVSQFYLSQIVYFLLSQNLHLYRSSQVYAPGALEKSHWVPV